MMPIDGIINGTNGIINQNRGEESMNAVIYAERMILEWKKFRKRNLTNEAA